MDASISVKNIAAREMPVRAVLNATDTAYYLSLTEAAVLVLAKQGQIPYRELGGECLFLIKELDAWLGALPGVSVYDAIARIRQAEACATVPMPSAAPKLRGDAPNMWRGVR
jgi:hypothetical protein